MTTKYGRRTDKTSNPLYPATAQWVDNNCDDIVALVPPPGDRWTLSDPTVNMHGNDHKWLLEQSLHHQLLEVVDRADANRRVFMTNATRWNRAKEAKEKRDSPTLPCGHSGTSTLSLDPPMYACGARHCDETYDRETAERSLRSH